MDRGNLFSQQMRGRVESASGTIRRDWLIDQQIFRFALQVLSGMVSTCDELTGCAAEIQGI